MLLNAALAVLGATAVAAVPSLEIRGSQFVNPKTGKAFQIAGMAYQPGGSSGYDPSHGRDPLSDGKVCMRDAALMQSLGVNTIRVYNLDPNLNHDECASIFNAAGMYMLLDVNSPLAGESLTNVNPWESYYMEYLNRTFAVVEAFKNYPNTLAFFSGNEVIYTEENAETVPPYMRAVTRDLKNYIKNNSPRKIPVGYSAADVRVVLEDSWNYFQCHIDTEQNDESRADLFALNSYSWCGDATFQSSGYVDLVNMFKTTSVPVFFSEFGCNTPSPRIFTEIGSIYGPDMTGTFAGGVVYEYTQEKNNYGLADINADNTINLRADFHTLQKQYAGVDFTSVQGVTASGNKGVIPKCSKTLIKQAKFNKNFTLPAVPPKTQPLINNGIKPAPVGKIIPISSWDVTYQVKDADGKVINNLKVVPVKDDAFNMPGSNAAVSGDVSGSSNSTSSGNNENAAGRLAPLGVASSAIAIPMAIMAAFMAGAQLI
ncbi:glycoside hydrolase family 72 protein [Microdochium trichocladiopsis]|uniref:1,3-beta-glucanosyltransferase n=1 Tax=Microdochium trichocladiopsis TaxID=1682393 RepID=A0A9P9BVV7_9PEZI|nr:glycoside hydrolase family 72 protein [Microdochium trichocladiopsis]KAH7039975.1 glycoside hydrolase family 72 protein [Microdochium trichocladiopsis]